MKLRVIFTLLSLMFLINVCSAHAPVRVSDYGSDGFFYHYNEVAQKMGKSDVLIRKMPQKQDSVSNENYNTYIGSIGTNNHAITISLFANMEGYVSKIMIGGKATDTIAMSEIGDILAVTLTTLGVNRGELSRFFNDWKDSSRAEIYHWCSATNRFIFINRNINYVYNTFSATFTAAA